MKISDLDVAELLGVISPAISDVLFRGLDRSTPANVWRERIKISAEVMGRITAVLQCGDEVGPDIQELIDICTRHMQSGYEESFAMVLGPGGSLSKIQKT
ncbi:hypothetical protein [Pseudomonas syringae group genomosp. 3]|uniref:hypothetical protein n=1 Tax=Pseudomonas syringae group genomosp. 3 TaxID=251701 RepID=UPI0006B8D6EE|nr:hypothetical protein [Pseudomonas syringae group genomosp. 3]